MTQEAIQLIFQYSNGRQRIINSKTGENFLELAKKHDLHIEGACGGVLACATCHVIIDDPWFEQLSPATIREERMLDNAQEVEINSRLCCQLKVTSQMNGMIVHIPASSEGEGHEH